MPVENSGAKLWCLNVVESVLLLKSVVTCSRRLCIGQVIPTQSSIPPGSVNEYQLLLGRQRQVWFIPLADVRGVYR